MGLYIIWTVLIVYLAIMVSKPIAWHRENKRALRTNHLLGKRGAYVVSILLLVNLDGKWRDRYRASEDVIDDCRGRWKPLQRPLIYVLSRFLAAAGTALIAMFFWDAIR